MADGASFGVRAGGSDALTRPTIYRRDSSSTQTVIVELAVGAEITSLQGLVKSDTGAERAELVSILGQIFGAFGVDGSVTTKNLTNPSTPEAFEITVGSQDFRQVLLGFSPIYGVEIFGSPSVARVEEMIAAAVAGIADIPVLPAARLTVGASITTLVTSLAGAEVTRALRPYAPAVPTDIMEEEVTRRGG